MTEPSVSSLIQIYKASLEQIVSRVYTFIESHPLKDDLRTVAEEWPLDIFQALKYFLSHYHHHHHHHQTPTKGSNERLQEHEIELAVLRMQDAILLRHKYRSVLAEARTRTGPISPFIPGTSCGFVGTYLVLVSRLARVNLGHMLTVTFGGNEERAYEEGIAVSERMRFMLDDMSRKTDRLHRIVSVLDFENASLFTMHSMFKREMVRALGKISKSNEILTPQLISKIVLIRAPASVAIGMSIFRRFASERTIAKIGTCRKASGGGGGGEAPISMCPYMQRLLTSMSSKPLPSSRQEERVCDNENGDSKVDVLDRVQRCIFEK